MSMSRRLWSIPTALAALLFVACASSPGTGAASAEVHPARNSDVITREELADPTLAGSTVLEAVTRLRPRFVNGRSGGIGGVREEVQVSINGGDPMAISELNRIALPQVTEIRYLSTADAGLRFGLRGSLGPVLLITTAPR